MLHGLVLASSLLIFNCCASENLIKPASSDYISARNVFSVDDFELIDVNTETVASRSRNIEATVSSYLNSGFVAIKKSEHLLQPQTPLIRRIYAFVKQLSPESPVKTLFLSVPDSNALVQLQIELKDGWINSKVSSIGVEP